MASTTRARVTIDITVKGNHPDGIKLDRYFSIKNCGTVNSVDQEIVEIKTTKPKKDDDARKLNELKRFFAEMFAGEEWFEKSEKRGSKNNFIHNKHRGVGVTYSKPIDDDGEAMYPQINTLCVEDGKVLICDGLWLGKIELAKPDSIDTIKRLMSAFMNRQFKLGEENIVFDDPDLDKRFGGPYYNW